MRLILIPVLFLPILFLVASPARAAIKPPGFSTIQRLCHKTQKMRDPRAHSRGVAVGDGRFFSVVHHRSADKSRWILDLVQLAKKGDAWAITGRWPVTMRSTIRGGHPTVGASLCSTGATDWKPASALFIKDYDGDGKLELLVRIKFCWMIPAIGSTSIRTMQIFNLDAKGIAKRPSLNITIEHDARPTTMGRTLGRYTFKDLNGDGHPDLLLRVTRSYADYIKEVNHQCTDRYKRRFVWTKANDRYVEVKGKKRRPKRHCKRAD